VFQGFGAVIGVTGCSVRFAGASFAFAYAEVATTGTTATGFTTLSKQGAAQEYEAMICCIFYC